jgi:predicted GH43/DUF377 family glycosyl hydrolase
MKFSLLAVIVAIAHISFAQQNKLPSWALGGFTRAVKAPIINPDASTRFYDPMRKDSIAWESNDTFNPAAAVKNGKIVVLYRSEDKSGIGIGERTSRIGYAESTDGIKMIRRKTPVLFPGEDDQKQYEWPGGCEDPRVAMAEDGTYVMLYTQWNRKVARLGVATSKDLIHWKKHGPAFAKAYDGRFMEDWSKSAAIVTKIKNGKQVIAKINGKYWMYYGEAHVSAATSNDLVNWSPVLDEKGELKKIMSPRDGYFDSHLTECGPPALLTNNGIVLLYNGKNKSDEDRDKKFTPGVYSAGQALFDKNDPTKFIARLDVPFLRPIADFEKSGQYKDGTVFIEGLVFFKNKWFLYYGCADSKVSVATWDGSKKNGDPLPF